MMREGLLRVAFAFFIVVVLVPVICLPKYWRSTPSGVMPEVKVSVVDMAQAWSMKRNAIKAESARDMELAYVSWQGAIENNLGDAEMNRGFIRFLLRTDFRLVRARALIEQSLWLLRLTDTNSADLLLTARAFNQYRMPARTLDLLENQAGKLSDDLQAERLKACFESDKMARFEVLWGQSSPALKENPELKLYHAALFAGQGSEPSGQLLSEAARNPALEVLALKLALRAAEKKGDLPAYEQTLARLKAKNADTALDHAALWQLMAAKGRKNEAVSLAQGFAEKPVIGLEAEKLGATFNMLGLRDKAQNVLGDGIVRFPDSPMLWVAAAEMLMESHNWIELQILAMKIREEPSVQIALRAYSHYLEGRAYWGQNRLNNAMENFKQALSGENINPDLALRMADSLSLLGGQCSGILKEFLARIEKANEGNPGYWQTVGRVAAGLKDNEMQQRAKMRLEALNAQAAPSRE